jgi:serralysin
MPKPVWTVEQIAAHLTRDRLAWSAQSPINYAFYAAPAPHLGSWPNFSPFSAEERQALARNFQLISDIAPLTFAEVPDNGQTPGPANPRIGFFNVNGSTVPFWGAATNFSLETSPDPDRMWGVDVVVNLYRANVQGGWSPGESNPRKLLHEAMHAIGISHPGDYNGDSALNYENEAEYEQDSHQYTVMSYWTADNTGAFHGPTFFASTPLLHDIAALQHLYGANMTTRTGDTVYGFNSTADRAAYDLSVPTVRVFSIWDAGGRDTLDLSGFLTPSRIDLAEGAFSDAGGLIKNISIAHGAVIENARGGTGDDKLSGNSAANRLEGGSGADRLGGGPGVDSLIGGSGGDVFVFSSLGDSQSYAHRSDGKKKAPDMLADFQSGVDRIDLSGIDAVWGTAANEAFIFVGAAAFSGQAGELRIVQGPDRVQVFADVDGNGIADFHLIVMSTTIAAADFIF